MSTIIKISQKLRSELWWMVVSVDFNYSRICIADHEISEDIITLWLEDKQDFKNSLEECLQLNVPLKQFAKLINAENFNSYEGTRMHVKKKFLYKTRVVINDAINWYLNDASPVEQQWSREALLKTLLTNLVENELFHASYYAN